MATQLPELTSMVSSRGGLYEYQANDAVAAASVLDVAS